MQASEYGDNRSDPVTGSVIKGDPVMPSCGPKALQPSSRRVYGVVGWMRIRPANPSRRNGGTRWSG